MARYRLKIIDLDKQDFLEKLEARVKGYLIQLSQNFKKLEEKDDKIENLINEVREIRDNLKIKENLRRKTAGKVGGLQKSLNQEKIKTKELLENKVDLEYVIIKKDEEIEIKELELKLKEAEIQMLRGNGKKRSVEDYKNFVECRHELEKRKKNEYQD